MNRREHSASFWNETIPAIDLNMVLSDSMELERAEKKEILSLLPSFNDLNVLELGGGIGRITGAIAESARSVTTVDLVSSFLTENKKRHRKKKNIQYIHSDVMDLDFAEGQFDFILMNWLMMYLEDKEVFVLRDRIFQWLKCSGSLFFRETCRPERTVILDSDEYFAIYRPIHVYTHVFDAVFHRKVQDSLNCYIDYKACPFQSYWMYQKRA